MGWGVGAGLVALSASLAAAFATLAPTCLALELPAAAPKFNMLAREEWLPTAGEGMDIKNLTECNNEYNPGWNSCVKSV